jgi:16S rRNA (guanine527-N7)-methyltransferase
MSTRSFRELLEARARVTHIQLRPELIDQFEAYYRLLAHWNSRINLTGLALDHPTPQAIDRLFLEPLSAISSMPSRVAVWFDLGTGGGSPAIPLQLAHPAERLIMVESRDRKAAFLREVVRELSLPGAEVEVSRIERVAKVSHNFGLADLITVRAVRVASSLLSDINTLLKAGGKAMLFGARSVELDLPHGLVEVEPTSGTLKPESRSFVFLNRTGR